MVGRVIVGILGWVFILGLFDLEFIRRIVFLYLVRFKICFS